MKSKVNYIIFLFLPFFLFFNTPEESEKLVIKGGKIFTITNGVIENGIIYIEDGKIKKIGEDVFFPVDAKIIDAKGKIVMPGLIDAHSDLMLSRSRINERTPSGPHYDIIYEIDPSNQQYKEVVANGVTTICVAPGNSQIIGGLAAVIKLNGSNNRDDMLVKSGVLLQASLGVAPMMSNRQSMPTTRMGNAWILRDSFFKAKDYIKQWENYRKDLEKYEKDKRKYDKDLAAFEKEQKEQKEKKETKETKQDTVKTEKEKKKPVEPKKPRKPAKNAANEVLVKVLNKEIPVRIEAHRADDIYTAIRISEEFGFNLIIDKGTEAFKIAEILSSKSIPVCTGPMAVVWGKTWEMREHTLKNPGILSKNGVKVTIESGGMSGMESKFLSVSAGLAVSKGMERDEALKAITINPAIILGISDKVGSLEVGKDGDVIILDGDPFQTLTNVEKVVINGKVVFER